MIIKKDIYGFKEIKYIFESPPDTEELKRKYSKVFIFTYDKLEMPGFERRHKKTPLIDLEKSEDEIFAKFNSTSRNEIRRSEKINGLEFKVEDENVDEAYNIYSGHEYAQGRVPERRAEFRNCKIFSAYCNKEMISVIICFYGLGYLRAKSISSKRLEKFDKEKLKIISFASRRLVWEICKYGRKHGYRGFDLGSINFIDSNKKGIAGFKQSFGGRIVDEYSYVYKSRLFRIAERFMALRILFKKYVKL